MKIVLLIIIVLEIGFTIDLLRIITIYKYDYENVLSLGKIQSANII